MAVSWLVGFLFSPLMSQAIAKGSFYQFLYYFTNGVDQLQASGNLAAVSYTHLGQALARKLEQKFLGQLKK